LIFSGPDKREREVIELIFKKFKELGSARQTYLWLFHEKISIPVNGRRDIADKKRRWRLQDQASTLVELLHSDTSYPA